MSTLNFLVIHHKHLTNDDIIFRDIQNDYLKWKIRNFYNNKHLVSPLATEVFSASPTDQAGKHLKKAMNYYRRF